MVYDATLHEIIRHRAMGFFPNPWIFAQLIGAPGKLIERWYNGSMLLSEWKLKEIEERIRRYVDGEEVI